MLVQDILMDRAFDAACLKVYEEDSWSDQILTRLKNTYPKYEEYIEGLFSFYVNMVSNNRTFLSRAEYMVEHSDKLKLRYK